MRMEQKLAEVASMAACDIVDLRDRPDFVEVCTSWWFQHWGLFKPHGTFDRLMKDSIEASATGTLPRCWIPVLNGEPVGSIFLKESEHPDYTHLSPWIGDLYVHPRFRQRGIAQTICAYVEQQAKQQYGFSACYVQTETPAFYDKMGWEGVEKIRDASELGHDGIVLMRKML